jgi:anti-sigma B factor antagonist
MDLSIETEKVGDAAVLHVAGEVDVFTAPQLREALVGVIEEGSRDVIVDLQGVDFLDSTGLGVLVAGLKRVRQYGGDLSLVCTREHILKILDITGLVKVLRVYDSVEAGTAAKAETETKD